MRPLLIVISAPSGAGKSTLCNRLLDRCEDIVYSVSCTTRAPRGGEVDGKNYFFMTPAAFEEKVRAGAFLEHALVHANHYGTLKEKVRTTMQQGQSILMDIDVQGARQVRDALASLPPNDLMSCGFLDIFIQPPTLEVLRARGYYDARLDVRLAGPEGHRRLVFECAAGPRYRIGKVTLTAPGVSLPTPAQIGLRTGEPARAETFPPREEGQREEQQANRHGGDERQVGLGLAADHVDERRECDDSRSHQRVTSPGDSFYREKDHGRQRGAEEGLRKSKGPVGQADELEKRQFRPEDVDGLGIEPFAADRFCSDLAGIAPPRVHPVVGFEHVAGDFAVMRFPRVPEAERAGIHQVEREDRGKYQPPH